MFNMLFCCERILLPCRDRALHQILRHPTFRFQFLWIMLVSPQIDTIIRVVSLYRLLQEPLAVAVDPQLRWARST